MIVDVTKVFAYIVRKHIITMNVKLNVITPIAEAIMHQDMKIVHVNKPFASTANLKNQTNSEIQFYLTIIPFFEIGI